MAKIIASCGHGIRKIPDPVMVKTRFNGRPAVATIVLCSKCLVEAQKMEVILWCDSSVCSWLTGKGEGEVWLSK